MRRAVLALAEANAKVLVLAAAYRACRTSMNPFSALRAWLMPTPAPAPEVRASLARVAEVLGQALAAEPDFERRLSGPVAHALSYCAALVDALPGAIEISRQSFANDPLVHTLFASADDIADTIGRSRALRAFLDTPAAWQQEHFHALLAARRHHKRVLGVANHGGVIATEVPQCLLYFSEHTLVWPALDESALRAALREAAFESLLQTFAEHLAAARQTRDSLKMERELEKTRIQRRPDDPQAERFTRRIAELDEQLRKLADALLAPQQLRALAEFLLRPEQALRINPIDLQVDRRGAIVQDGPSAARDAMRIRFIEATGRDRRRYVLQPVQLRSDEAREAFVRARELRDRLLVL